MNTSTRLENFFDIDIIPPNESARIRALRRYHILDTPPEEAFDNLAHIIADDFNIPIALISLVDERQVFYKAGVGMPGVTHAERGLSLCSLAVLDDEPTIFTHPLEDPCLLRNPLVHGAFGLRFYAGAPITTPDGFRIGTVCILDKKERRFGSREKSRLVRYAKVVMHELEVRLAVKTKTEALAQEYSQRQKLITEAVVKAQERERSFIAGELHDNVNQILTTVKLYNEMAMDNLGDPKSLLKKSYGYLQACIDEIRSLSKRLSAPSLGNATLDHTISELVESINLTRKVAIECLITGEEYCKVGKDLHLAVYRIVQEQLNNIIKHAGAQQVTVELHKSNTTLSVIVADNGCGFDMVDNKAGIGLANIRARAESLDGACTLYSALGAGCTLRVSFPLKTAEVLMPVAV